MLQNALESLRCCKWTYTIQRDFLMEKEGGGGGGLVRGEGVAYIRGDHKISNFNLAIFQLFL